MSFGRFILIALSATLMSGCVKLTIAWADLEPNGVVATPPIFGSLNETDRVVSTDTWMRARVPTLRSAMEKYVYGYFPDASETTIISRRILDEGAFNNLAHLEEYELQASSTFGETKNTSRTFFMNVVRPKNLKTPAPVILMQTFCPRADTIPHPAIEGADRDGCGGGGFFSGVISYIFGRYISTPPIKDILQNGYAIATIYPSEIVRDAADAGLADLRSLSTGHKDDTTRWGAIAAWGWSFSRMIDVLEQDPALDPNGMITFGHSRYGKAALVAGAYDERIDAVVSHQSGTGGASLNIEKKGESVGEITEGYPHWFSKTYSHYAGKEEQMPIDQHMLLALIAPRPVLLGNARRDVWSDPNGAFRAAIGATPAYELFGKRGLDQKRLKPFDPSSELAFWLRSGTHGIVEEDWPAFLAFLNAHFKKPAQ